MQIDIITIFPEYFSSPLKESIIANAQKKGLVCINIHNLRDYTTDKHKVVDDYPYGGGAGMVLKPEPIFNALEKLKEHYKILLTPEGEVFNQAMAQRLKDYPKIAFICGRYEGIDERVKEIIDLELSIGDYVLSGGEVACLVVLETIIRLIPNVLGNPESLKQNAFYDGLLSYPMYTRPANFKGLKVPEVLLSGDHKKIAYFRRYEALKRTLLKKPYLLEKAKLSREDEQILQKIKEDANIK
jgi:tRNA (guanine37-N1)-methyltransferase